MRRFPFTAILVFATTVCTASAFADGAHISDAERNYWAFQPIQKPPPPDVSDEAWSPNPIDAFIYRKLDEQGLEPADPASRRTLIRRAHYDLVGLPPSPEEVRAFVNDPDPNAYGKLLDYLLTSPHYGEKWGRHWLDIVRYAESNGYERDTDKPYIWRYRDYVIKAFNEDKPYDQFVKEQLAGDELDCVTPDSIAATGYYRLGIWDDEPVDPLQARYDVLDGVVDATAQAFLGITLGCARCHEHKLDPIPQADYYRFLAFFDNITDMSKTGIVRSILSPFKESVRQQKIREKKAYENALQEDIANFENTVLVEIAKRLNQSHTKPQPISAESIAEYSQFRKALAASKKRRVPGKWAAAVEERGAERPETYVHMRGNAHVHGDRVEPGFLTVLDTPKPEIEPPQNEPPTTGMRRALAEWIASPDNPLTARVMVNRIWQHHFGRGIVRTPNNFGAIGMDPTHPELLDWLAAEFIDSGWSIKHMHRLIMTSNTYRMASTGNPDGLQKDPENDYIWRFEMRRLTAEELRDSVLAVSGTLNLRMGGPSFYPDLPEEALATSSQPDFIWGESPEEELTRRSIYIHYKRSLLPPLLTDFDLADTDNSCDVRFVTVQPTQALNLLNSEFVNEQAAHLADRLRREAGEEIQDQVALGLNLVTQREPKPDEIDRGVQFARELREDYDLPPEKALQRFALLALNLNEFIFLD